MMVCNVPARDRQIVFMFQWHFQPCGCFHDGQYGTSRLLEASSHLAYITLPCLNVCLCDVRGRRTSVSSSQNAVMHVAS